MYNTVCKLLVEVMVDFLELMQKRTLEGKVSFSEYWSMAQAKVDYLKHLLRKDDRLLADYMEDIMNILDQHSQILDSQFGSQTFNTMHH